TNYPDLVAIKDRPEFKDLAAQMQARTEADRTRSGSIAKLQNDIRDATATTFSPTATAEENEAAHRKLIDLRAELDKLVPQYHARPDQAASKQAIGLVELDRGNVEAAAKMLREAVALREEMVNLSPNHPLYQADLISARVALGKLHWANGRKPEA